MNILMATRTSVGAGMICGILYECPDRQQIIEHPFKTLKSCMINSGLGGIAGFVIRKLVPSIMSPLVPIILIGTGIQKFYEQPNL